MLSKAVVQKLTREIPAVVVSAGQMAQTVKVRVGVQRWNDHIKKNFNSRKHVLVHDPNDSLRTGDVVSISSGWRVSKNVHHILNKIIAPFGTPIEERPPVPGLTDRLEEKNRRKMLKLENRRRRRMGLPRIEPKSDEGKQFEVDEAADETSLEIDASNRWEDLDAVEDARNAMGNLHISNNRRQN